MIPGHSPYGHSTLPSVSGTGTSILKCPISKDTLDGAVLVTIPEGHRVRLARGWLEVTTAFTGGASSAIGASSSNAGYNTKGDLVGGAAGDVAAGLTVGVSRGTVGTKTSVSLPPVILVGGDTIKFDRIVSIFTAGAGFMLFEVVEIGA